MMLPLDIFMQWTRGYSSQSLAWNEMTKASEIKQTTDGSIAADEQGLLDHYRDFLFSSIPFQTDSGRMVMHR